LFHYDWALKLDPDNDALWADRGSFHSNSKDWSRAVHDFREALKRKPGDVDRTYDLGVALLAGKERADYVRVCRESWQKYEPGKLPLLLVWLVVLDADALESWDEALAVVDREMKAMPSSLPVLVARGMVLLRMKRYGEALAAFDQAENVRGEQYKKTGRYIEPLSVWAHASRAMTLQRLGRGEEAAKSLAFADKLGGSEGRSTNLRLWETLAGNLVLLREANQLISGGEKSKSIEKK